MCYDLRDSNVDLEAMRDGGFVHSDHLEPSVGGFMLESELAQV